LEKEINISDIHRICAGHQIKIDHLKLITGSFGKKIFFINQNLLLRVSEHPMINEQKKFRRVAALDFVPKLIQSGVLNREVDPLYYTLLTLLPGDDFVNIYHETTEAQQKQLGEAVANFLNHLQELNGRFYDIGLYEAIPPGFSGAWRDGHIKYWQYLRKESEKLPLNSNSIRVFERAYQFLNDSAGVLDFQTGPKLLHNDFHPANIILHQGEFSGVIDWECSQFGDADFELCHMIHWCLYPPKPTINFRVFLRAFLEASPRYCQVPDLTQRLTLYQIEHEIQQIIWNVGQAESWRVPRLESWMDGAVDQLFREMEI